MIVEIQIGEGAVFNKLIYGCLVNPHDSASERPSCLKFKGFDREMHTLVVVSDAVKKRVETTYEENANRDAEVPVGVGGAGAVNMTLAEGRNAVKRSSRRRSSFNYNRRSRCKSSSSSTRFPSSRKGG